MGEKIADHIKAFQLGTKMNRVAFNMGWSMANETPITVNTRKIRGNHTISIRCLRMDINDILEKDIPSYILRHLAFKDFPASMQKDYYVNKIFCLFMFEIFISKVPEIREYKNIKYRFKFVSSDKYDFYPLDKNIQKLIEENKVEWL